MPTGIQPVFGRPGIGTAQVAQRRNVSRNGALDFYPAGGTIKGSKARDPGNSAYSTRALRAGLMMGKITSGGYWANAVYGLTNGALASGGTTVTFASAAAAVELARRVGATGTFKLTGPPTAAGVVRTLTATYSALDTTNGTATITALGVNEVQTLTPTGDASAGSWSIELTRADGTVWTTGPLAFSASIATIQTALDIATGVANGIVVAGTGAPIDIPNAMTLTFSGTGYAALPFSLVRIIAGTSITANTGWNVTRTTAGVDGRFVTASLVQPTDGSETIKTMIPDGYGVVIPDDDSDVNFALIPIAGTVDAAQVVDWPADASLKTYIRTALEISGGGKWIFSDMF